MTAELCRNAKNDAGSRELRAALADEAARAFNRAGLFERMRMGILHTPTAEDNTAVETITVTRDGVTCEMIISFTFRSAE